MRMTGFIAGSVLGMVGAFALMKKKPSMAKAVQSVFGDMKSNMMSTAVSTFTNSQQAKQSSSAQQASSSQASNHSKANVQSSSKTQNQPSNHQMNVSMIEGIIKNDPELQSTVNEIKNEAKSIQH